MDAANCAAPVSFYVDKETDVWNMKDKTVVITGATSGLGRATALQLAQKGAFVIFVARNNSKANEFIKEIEKEGGKGKFIISDLSSMKDTKRAAESITKVVDRLDVLINNAGGYFPKYSLTSEGFESTLALNFLSPFLLTHHLVKQMEQTASDYGEARYQSKHLLTSFTYYLSNKLKEMGISVNCIHPGFVKTALAQADYPFPMSVIVPIVGFFIGESPEQAADTPVWLASSNEAKGINGEYVHHRKIKKSWPPTRDEDSQTRLFNVTQSMLGEWL